MEPLNITITDLSLDTVVGAEYDGSLTLADLIVNAAVARLTKDQAYVEVLGRRLRDRIAAIRDEEIRALVKAELEPVMTEPVTPTSQWGESVGKPTTLRALVLKAAEEFFTKRRDEYRQPRTTEAERIVAAEVGAALTKELKDAVAAEKAKVVAAVQAKAAELIATAVKEGVGR